MINNLFKLACLTIFLANACLNSQAQQYRVAAQDNLSLPKQFGIFFDGKNIRLKADFLERSMTLTEGGLVTRDLFIDKSPILEQSSKEFAVTFFLATPDAKPVGIKDGDVEDISQEAGIKNYTDILKMKEAKGFVKQSTHWVNATRIDSDRWSKSFDNLTYFISMPKPGVTRLTLRVRSTLDNMVRDVSINLVYEVYDGYPAIRKWAEITNNGIHWLKVDSLVIDGLVFSKSYRHSVPLTPSERGAGSCLRSFQNEAGTIGAIVGSEVPSALRQLTDEGTLGYEPQYFEWVLGPTEKFVSEPVFIYAYSGEIKKTVSGSSSPLDRSVENKFQKFLRNVVGVLPPVVDDHVPLWCSWSNFGPLIDDRNIREMADVAVRAGFKTIQLDAGWALSDAPEDLATSTIQPDTLKFSDFKATTDYITSKGLQLGLWVSCYRHPELSTDFAVLPNANILPRAKRENGLAMSFTSNWRYYYANSILSLRDVYGATYFKQDLTNIKLGDISAAHESRTHKESLLRGLRGLLEATSIVTQSAPDVMTELTHELYWGTPGVPCDLAALKNANIFHIPPNDYSGTGHRKKRYDPKQTYRPDSLRQKLIEGCFNARSRFFAHRGLPLYGIEYYGAATYNLNGSLSEQVQQRQVCSWLMGASSVYAGDLSSLTAENIRAYKTYFDILDDLNRKYHIYSFFQYSGVPTPTDTDWHWWGKLNEEGYGAIVVLRGNEGAASRNINIPWVAPGKKYHLTLKFSKRDLGHYKGKDLIDGKLELMLPALGQEIIELSAVN